MPSHATTSGRFPPHRPRAWLIACAAAVLLLAGCARFRLAAPMPDPAGHGGQAMEYRRVIVHDRFWGSAAEPRILFTECTQGIRDVILHRSLAHDLAGVLTLGMWMPVELHYRCVAPPEKPAARPSPSRKRSRTRGLS